MPPAALILALVAVFGLGPAASCSPAHSPTQLSLPQVVERTLEFHFKPRLPAGPGPLAGSGNHSSKPTTEALAEFVASLPVASAFKRSAGVFVTLSRAGKSRACWGSVFPEHQDLVKATIYATLGALTKEYRYSPVRSNEWKLLKPQVTVVQAVEPIAGLWAQNPLRDGLMVRSRGKAAVILPGEARDAHYQLRQCQLKAGIRPGEPCQLYSIKAEVYD